MFLYTHADFYMLRAPALSAQIFTRLSTAGHISAKTALGKLDTALQIQQRSCSQLLRELASQPQITQALAVASPSLQEGLERLQQGKGSLTQQKRTYAGLMRYLIRMSTRPTPFGLFSGVASGTFDDETQAHLVSPTIARFRTRPDMQWLLAVLRKLEEDRALVVQLRVQLNQTAYLVGERAVLPFADTYGGQDNRTISLRATTVVRRVFELAQQFIPYTELQCALQQTFPQATIEQVERVLWQLWEYHFLISELHPPLTDARPADYVWEHLNALQGVEEIKAQLTCVLEGASALDCAGIGVPTSMISALVKQQGELVPAEEDKLPLQVDTALHVQNPLLHHAVGQVAAQAAEFLLRQTPQPTGLCHLQEYRSLFLEKYSEQAEVPLLDLLSPENGLDAPASYEKPPRVSQRPVSSQPSAVHLRDQVLLNLVAEAINKRDLEVELTDEIQQRLERWSPKLEQVPLSLEIYLQLHAESREAVDRGEWSAVVGRNCGSPNGGCTFGRFFDLLGEPGMERLRNLARREEMLQPNVIFAELSYQPLQARQANVAIRPPIRTYEIAVGTTPSVPPERVILLNDLVVGIQHGRFYLRSLRLGKQVRVCQTHMLNIQLAPNVCRFISEIASDGQPVLRSFDWGAVAHAPFLPRLVIKTGLYSRLIITPACWQLQAEAITPTGEGSDEACWFRGLQAWREQWRVPRYVYLTEGDNRLLLDLENSLMAAELRDELAKHDGTRRILLDELLPDFEHLWLRDEQDAGYFSEIVVPVLRTDAVDPTIQPEIKEKTFPLPHRVISPTKRNCFPGEDWSYLKLYAAPSQHENLLAGPVCDLVGMLQEHKLIDRWFFIRYADPEPHLRLRFHAQAGVESAAILAFALPWSTRLARRGQIQRSVLDTYEREIERYGGPEAIDLLEQVFTVNSVMVSNLIGFQHVHRLTLDPLAVAVFTLDYFFTSWGCGLQQRLEWTHQVSEKYAFSKEFRPERKRYCDLLAPCGQIEASLAEQRALLLDLMRPHERPLGKLGAQVRQLGEAGKLWVPEISLLSSLAHMHHNRLLGIDQARENKMYAFWRHALDSLERRPVQGYVHA